MGKINNQKKEEKVEHIIKSEEEINTITQRNKIIKYLIENYPDIKKDYSLNFSVIAAEITDNIYPELTGSKKKKKKNSIRQELMQIRNGKIPFNI